MRTSLLYCVAPIASIPVAFWFGLQTPFALPVILGGMLSVLWGWSAEEKPGRSFAWNLLPLAVVWPVVTLTMAVTEGKPPGQGQENSTLLLFAAWAYGALVLAAIYLSRKNWRHALGIQAVLFLYALGEYFMCDMSLKGDFL